MNFLSIIIVCGIFIMLIVFVQRKSINGMQEGLDTGSVNTQKEKVLDNLLLISKLTAMASADEVNGL
uniref:hypothetical protein n=1 Tax=Prevotella sp. TaxID=59823 RepID=UPI004028985E